MKASYSKPLLAVELFSFSRSTARDCADNIPKQNVNFNNISSCSWELYKGVTVFVGGVTCTYDGQNMGLACYNAPGEGMYMFRS